MIADVIGASATDTNLAHYLFGMLRANWDVVDWVACCQAHLPKRYSTTLLRSLLSDRLMPNKLEAGGAPAPNQVYLVARASDLPLADNLYASEIRKDSTITAERIYFENMNLGVVMQCSAPHHIVIFTEGTVWSKLREEWNAGVVWGDGAHFLVSTEQGLLVYALAALAHELLHSGSMGEFTYSHGQDADLACDFGYRFLCSMLWTLSQRYPGADVSACMRLIKWVKYPPRPGASTVVAYDWSDLWNLPGFMLNPADICPF